MVCVLMSNSTGIQGIRDGGNRHILASGAVYLSLLPVVFVLVSVIASVGVGGALPNDSLATLDQPADDPEDELEIHYINVGQADATLVITPTNETMLIDSGDWRDDGETVLRYLETHEIERIDYLVATHAHADHIGGHAAIIEHYESEKDGIGEVWDSGVPHTTQTYENYLDAIEEHDVDLVVAREGDELPLAGVNVTLFNPPHDSDYPDDQYYNSLTLLVEYENSSFLFTGDAQERAESRMANEYGEYLDADVYQAGHHGSESASTDEFLETVAPQLTVLSSAYDSQYGHPHNETLDRFAAHGVETYWTGTHGTIVLTTNGTELVVKTQHDAPTDPQALRDGEEATADPVDPVEERERAPVDSDAELKRSLGLPTGIENPESVLA